MKTTAGVVVLAMALLVGGCATGPRYWAKPGGMAPGEGEQALAECKYAAEVYGYVPYVPAPVYIPPPHHGMRRGDAWAAAGAELGHAIGSAIAEATRKRAIFERCMEAKGFEIVPASQIRP